MKKLLIIILLTVTSFTSVQAEDQSNDFYKSNDGLEFVACEEKMSCLDRDGFLNAVYAFQATFGVVNAVCLAFPEPVVTKTIVALNAGLGVASLILKNLPCEDEGELNGNQRQEVLEEICRLTGGTYDQFLDKCSK
ncbi:MAG: hypothetical protein KC493_11900 [Bacteriovoracaceae bacterium]|nr:hypothetical protein [Bacteriovoracaceae bacterium]